MVDKKLKVIVVYGGDSAEREVSLNSGSAVIDSLENQGMEVTKVDGVKQLLSIKNIEGYDIVFNILHGGSGENGELASLLTLLKVPFTGCDSKGAVLSWNKDIAKLLVSEVGINTPESKVNTRNNISKPNSKGPWIVKPTQEGSSVGLYFVESESEIVSTIQQSLKSVDSVLCEQYIKGEECTVAIVGDQTLPVVRIVPNEGLYDYEAKYKSTETGYFCPSGFGEKLESKIKDQALIAYKALNLKGWARIDFIVDENEQCWFLEANTTPGMTQTSLVPKAAKAFGWNFDELVMKIIESSLMEEQHV